jgi:preprotein translocase subunit YajC
VENVLLGFCNLPALWLLQLPGGSSLLSLAPLLFIFAIFYFLLIMPQQKKQKKWQAMLSELKNGDKIVTSGGLRGTIISLKDDSLVLRVPPDNLKLEVSRASVVSVTQGHDCRHYRPHSSGA